MHHEWRRATYTISTDPARLDIDLIYNFLATQSYWAQDRTLDTVRTSINHSLPFGRIDAYIGQDIVTLAAKLAYSLGYSCTCAAGESE